ncbi:MAG: IS1634 family transposase [Candidatus Pacebacteria bacterium]|nr:IS1634 family transposase [Candidatus Paceibacterota bacterium]
MIDSKSESFGNDRFYRISDKLFSKKRAIEDKLYRNAKSFFNLTNSLVLYDLTNTYFEGRKPDSKIAGFNRSKDKRNDRPLITLALVVDQMGFPKQSRILSGACVEIETIPNLLDQLQDDRMNWLTPEKTIVIDAGMASDKNLALIRERGLHYVAVSRKRKYSEDFWDSAVEESIPLADSKQSLTVRLIKTETEIFLLCRSPHKLIKEQSIITRRQQKFEKALRTLNENLSKKRATKRYDKILEKIGRLKQQYQVGYLYTIDVQHTDDLCTYISFQKKNPSPQKPPGEYVLRTDRLDLSAQNISEIHRSLTTIEDSFSSMKGHLGLRPNFHHTDAPTIAHIFITVLAYHIMSVILKKLKNRNINYNWSTLRSILSTHIRLTSTMQTKEQKTIHIRSNTRPDERQTLIYNALGIAHDPLGQVKSIYPSNHKCSDENLSSKNLNSIISTT